jgi:hypothetical protein
MTRWSRESRAPTTDKSLSSQWCSSREARVTTHLRHPLGRALYDAADVTVRQRTVTPSAWRRMRLLVCSVSPIPSQSLLLDSTSYHCTDFSVDHAVGALRQYAPSLAHHLACPTHAPRVSLGSGRVMIAVILLVVALMVLAAFLYTRSHILPGIFYVHQYPFVGNWPGLFTNLHRFHDWSGPITMITRMTHTSA